MDLKYLYHGFSANNRALSSELHEMILDGPHIAFTFNSVPSFQSLVKGRHDITLMKYITNFKNSIE